MEESQSFVWYTVDAIDRPSPCDLLLQRVCFRDENCRCSKMLAVHHYRSSSSLRRGCSKFLTSDYCHEVQIVVSRALAREIDTRTRPIHSQLYVIGGSVFDTRSFPINHLSSSSYAFRFDVLNSAWESLSSMLSPCGSFVCTAIPNFGRILVAGGVSRHTMFGAAGSRMSSVEMYDIGKDEWVALDHSYWFFLGRCFSTLLCWHNHSVSN